MLGLSEVGLAVFKRAEPGTSRAVDRGSLRVLWGVIMLSIFGAYSLARAVPTLDFGPAAPFVDVGMVIFGTGLVLRWYAIVYLGRFFTVNVAIANDHQLVDAGPFRHIRHPSYAGALMAFLGLGFCLCNWGSMLAITLPPTLVFAWRMRIEEDALSLGLGDAYRDYIRRTKRLIPGIY